MEDRIAELSRMSVRELKELIVQSGATAAGCIEKGDLVLRAIEASAQAQTRARSRGIQSKRATIHGFECVQVDNDDQPSKIVVVFHGYGANRDDLAPLADAILRRVGDELKLRFVFPNALTSLGGSSFAWWPLDLMRVISLAHSGRISELFGETPDGLVDARTRVLEWTTAVAADAGLSLEHVVIAGFSQGGMLAVDVTLHAPVAPAALVAISPAPVCEPQWRTVGPNRAGLKAIVTHGRSDPVLPFQVGEHVQQILTDCGLDVEFMAFSGGHQLHPGLPERFVQLLQSLK